MDEPCALCQSSDPDVQIRCFYNNYIEFLISRGQDHLAKKVSDEMREQSFVTAYHPDFPLFRKLAHKNVDLHLTQNACESLIIGEFVKRMLKSHAAVVQSIYPYIDTLAHCELFKRI